MLLFYDYFRWMGGGCVLQTALCGDCLTLVSGSATQWLSSVLVR